MGKGKSGLYDVVTSLINENYGDDVHALKKRDMGGEHLIVKYENDDGEWESYLVTAERVN